MKRIDPRRTCFSHGSQPSAAAGTASLSTPLYIPNLSEIEMTGIEPSKTLPPSSNHLHPNPPLPVLGLPPEDFPCLPPKSTPNLVPPNPHLPSPHALLDSAAPSPSPNPWKKPSNLEHLKTRKFILRFIPPTPRGHNLIGICPSEAVAGELQILDYTLVGFFLGRKPGFSFVRSNLLKQWKLRGTVQVLQLIQGGFAFRFSDLEDRDQILEAGVYYVSGQPIFFRSWERNIHSGGILGLKQIPLWVSLPGLPLHLWGEDSLSAVCSVLGKPLYSDRITAEKSRWSFARVCVEFSGDSPLLDSIIDEDDVGNIFQQPVKYDWKPPHCISCGIFGHLQDSCKQDPPGKELDKEQGSGEASEEEAAAKIARLNQRTDFGSVQTGEEINSDAEKGKGIKPSQALLNLGKEKSFSELLQKRTSKLLRSWNPVRVKKTGPVVKDQTRNPIQMQTHRQQTDLKLNPDHVSTSDETDGGPIPSCLDKDGLANPLSSPHVLVTDSNFKISAHLDPPLTNRFGILDLDLDTSSCSQPDDDYLSNSEADISERLESAPVFGSSTQPEVGLSIDSNLTIRTPMPHPGDSFGSGNLDRPPFTPITSPSPFTPVNGPTIHISEPAHPLSDPKASSKGRTPYPSKSLTLSRTVQSPVLRSQLCSNRTSKPTPPVERDKLREQPILDSRSKVGIDDDLFVRTSELNDPRRIRIC